MEKLIGFQSGLGYEFGTKQFHLLQRDLSSRLKQYALLFDRIGNLGLDESTSPMIPLLEELRKEEKPLILELEWLRQTGVIFEPSIYINEESVRTVIGEPLFSKYEEKYEKFRELIKEKPKKIAQSFEEIPNRHPTKEEAKDFLDLIRNAATINQSRRELDSIILRLLSLIVERTAEITVVTTLPIVNYTHEVPNSRKSESAQILVNKLPLPNGETPWEQIIDYRNDPENQKNLLNLRRWIRKISNENLSPAEIEEEIEWLINEFQSHMRIHKMKANTETLEVLIKAPLEIIENLIKIKFSKIPEPLFALKKRQINLMEAELNAPGKEMSYIIKTRDIFQPN